MKLSATLGFLIVMIVGCSSSTTSNGPITLSPSIFPLAVGNRWIGRITNYNSAGIPDSIWYDTMQVTSGRVVENETWYTINNCNFGSDSYEFVNRSEGLFACDSQQFSKTFQILKYPAHPGDTFNFSLKGSLESLHYTLYYVNVDTTEFEVSVPAGTFKCNAYRVFSSTRSGDFGTSVITPEEYFSAGEGLVQKGYFDSTGRMPSHLPTSVWQLVKADLHSK